VTLTLTLTPEKESRLAALARRAGLSLDEYVQRVIDQTADAPETPTPSPVSPTLALYHRWAAEAATDDPAEIARRTQETDELSAALQAAPFSLRTPELPDDPEKELAA
jgi:hypothetical protein